MSKIKTVLNHFCALALLPLSLTIAGPSAQADSLAPRLWHIKDLENIEKKCSQVILAQVLQQKYSGCKIVPPATSEGDFQGLTCADPIHVRARLQPDNDSSRAFPNQGRFAATQVGIYAGNDVITWTRYQLPDDQIFPMYTYEVVNTKTETDSIHVGPSGESAPIAYISQTEGYAKNPDVFVAQTNSSKQVLLVNPMAFGLTDAVNANDAGTCEDANGIADGTCTVTVDTDKLISCLRRGLQKAP